VTPGVRQAKSARIAADTGSRGTVAPLPREPEAGSRCYFRSKAQTVLPSVEPVFHFTSPAEVAYR
jgi:hypothetical protein